MTDMTKAQYAKSLFMSGFNCSQSVVAAFADEMGMDKAFVAQLTIGFGGGVGRMREVCGTVTGMTFVISALYKEDKGSIYARVQEVAEEFKKENGSIVCRELLGLDIKGADSPVPEKRTQQYYQKRPCAELVEMAADILDNYLKSHPYK